MLLLKYQTSLLEAGIDEAGRGCLAGPVVAAAVILPPTFVCEELNDSKKLSEAQRFRLREIILAEALAYHVAFISEKRVDEVNILQATFDAMHAAVAGLAMQPEFLCIDGNRFRKHDIPHISIVKGDGKYMHIAAASVLAKTFRDEYMEKIDLEFPQYGWKNNKGYPTAAHRSALEKYGVTEHHRKTFQLFEAWTLF